MFAQKEGLTVLCISFLVYKSIQPIRSRLNINQSKSEFSKLNKTDVPSWKYLDNLWNEESIKELKNMFRQAPIESLAADDLPDTPFDHIGERLPINADGSCPNRYVINKKRTYCVFMGRLDVIENYVKTGGVNGGKYTMDRLYQRANSFIRMVTNREEFQHMQSTMKSDKLETEVRSICGQDSIIEPFMINLLIMLPGQALPVHYDVPLFTDMRKDAAPVWLQVALALSNMRREKEVRQIQFVGYVNGDREDKTQGGEFVFWPEGANGPRHEVPANPNSAIVVDGVHVAHGVAEWQPKGLNRSPPQHTKDDDSHVTYDEETQKWTLFRNGVKYDTYEEDDLRMSIVSRYRCFDNAELQAEYHSTENKISLDDVLELLMTDMKLNRSTLSPAEIVDKIMETYIQYSDNTKSLINFNYCILPDLVESKTTKSLLATLISPLCN